MLTLVPLELTKKNPPVHVTNVITLVKVVVVQVVIAVILVTHTISGKAHASINAQMVNTKQHQPILVKTVWNNVLLVLTPMNVLVVQKMMMEHILLIFMKKIVLIVQQNTMEMTRMEHVKNVIQLVQSVMEVMMTNVLSVKTDTGC